MKKAFVIIAATIISFSKPIYANTWCEITNFTVGAYDHGGVYLAGKVGGIDRAFIVLCGLGGCEDKATDRRLSLALAAQMASRKLNGFFQNVTDCSQIKNYDRVVYLVVKNE